MFGNFLLNFADNMNNRRICIVTTTRADWGLLSPIARRLADTPGIELQIIASNMHLDPLYGMTAREIEADGFEISARVPMPTGPDDSQAATARAAAACTAGMADAFERLRPDLAVMLGDRYEMLAAAQAAAIMRIPIVHIAGGELSEGAVDDSMRHAITKLASLHLTATEPYRQRVITMGEHPERVINTGAIGVYNALTVEPLPREELERSLGIPLTRHTLVVTLHPATMDDATPTATVCANMLEAFRRLPADTTFLITYPNNDADGRVIIDMIEAFGRELPDRVKVIPSLGQRRYLSVLRYAGAVVGNSSSGIVEVPSMKIPTVDIGPRQKSRIAAASVIHCDTSADAITHAIEHALSPQGQLAAHEASNPYYQPDTLARIADAIAGADIDALKNKRFYDRPCKA